MRYFFHMRTQHDFVEDFEGVELPDMTTVHREAVLDAQSFLAERIKTGKQVESTRLIEITDETGAVVHSLPLVAVLLASLTPVRLPFGKV